MATNPDDPERIKQINRELRESLESCEKLLKRARKLLLQSGQDNEPSPTHDQSAS